MLQRDQQSNFRFQKNIVMRQKCRARVGYLTIATSLMWLISYKLRLSHMASDVGHIFLIAS